MNYKKLVIEYSNVQLQDSISVEYRLLDYSIAQRWASRVIAAQQFPYPIDHPGRFYGFGTWSDQVNAAINDINKLVDFISNEHKIPINRRLLSIDDQDTLNYFHHIFESHHGLLDADVTNSIKKTSLSDLNILVHRCESIQRGAKPRHVVTYFGLPKTKILEESDYQYFTSDYKFGTVYLNYAEVGKTLEDLTQDNDQYITNDAFQPFKHYSADFNVKFYNRSTDEVNELKYNMKEYYIKNIDFFKQQGINFNSPYLKPGSIPVAELETNLTLEDIKPRQWVKSVKLYE